MSSAARREADFFSLFACGRSISSCWSVSRSARSVPSGHSSGRRAIACFSIPSELPERQRLEPAREQRQVPRGDDAIELGDRAVEGLHARERIAGRADRVGKGRRIGHAWPPARVFV
jgi:hypothetical protein